METEKPKRIGYLLLGAAGIGIAYKTAKRFLLGEPPSAVRKGILITAAAATVLYFRAGDKISAEYSQIKQKVFERLAVDVKSYDDSLRTLRAGLDSSNNALVRQKQITASIAERESLAAEKYNQELFLRQTEIQKMDSSLHSMKTLLRKTESEKREQRNAYESRLANEIGSRDKEIALISQKLKEYENRKVRLENAIQKDSNSAEEQNAFPAPKYGFEKAKYWIPFREGISISHLAQRYLGDARFAFLIMKENGLRDTSYITPGRDLVFSEDRIITKDGLNYGIIPDMLPVSSEYNGFDLESIRQQVCPNVKMSDLIAFNIKLKNEAVTDKYKDAKLRYIYAPR